MSNKLIDIVNISKAFDENVVLDELNLYIRENEFLTLLGPSGCGKTTLLNTLGLLDQPSEGEYYLDDVAVDISARDDALKSAPNTSASFSRISILFLA